MTTLLIALTTVNVLLTLSNLFLGNFVLRVRNTASSLLKQLTQKADASSTRSLTELDAEVAALTSSFSSLSTTVKRLHAREGMRDVRERRKQELDPDRLRT